MYKKILMPTDGSPLSEMTAQAGIELAQKIAAETVGVFVAPEYQHTIYGESLANRFPTREGYALSMQKSGEVYLGTMQKMADKAGVTYAGILRTSNDTAQAIVDTAQEYGCDLIFMASHGHSGLGKLLLGSVTSKVLALCDMPVFVYRAKEELHARRRAA